MTPEVFLRTMIRPGLTELQRAGGPTVSAGGERFMLAIAMQESGANLTARFQGSPAEVAGPAKGWWQFELAGVTGVLNHNATAAHTARFAERCHVVLNAPAIYRAIEGHDVLAAGIARLLIWTDPQALPADEGKGWERYLWLWRPGKPWVDMWPRNWAVATQTIEANTK